MDNLETQAYDAGFAMEEFAISNGVAEICDSDEEVSIVEDPKPLPNLPESKDTTAKEPLPAKPILSEAPLAAPSRTAEKVLPLCPAESQASLPKQAQQNFTAEEPLPANRILSEASSRSQPNKAKQDRSQDLPAKPIQCETAEKPLPAKPILSKAPLPSTDLPVQPPERLSPELEVNRTVEPTGPELDLPSLPSSSSGGVTLADLQVLTENLFAAEARDAAATGSALDIHRAKLKKYLVEASVACNMSV